MPNPTLTPDDKFVLVVNDRHGSEHLVTAIAGHPFYQSSGQNSHRPGTWFPFNGIGDDGWFVKPHGVKFNFQPDPLQWLFDKCHILTFNRDTIGRLAGVDTLCISYLISGGLWTTRTAIQDVSIELERRYPIYLGKLRQRIPPQPHFNQMALHAKEFSIANKRKNIPLFNSWLAEMSHRIIRPIPGDSNGRQAVLPECGYVNYSASVSIGAPIVEIARGGTGWVPDEGIDKCSCGEDFSFLNRRHHCRVCGKIFCSDCCNNNPLNRTSDSPMPYLVCKGCKEQILWVNYQLYKRG